MIQVIADYLKQPLLSALRTGNYTFYSDETTDITFIEQFSVYMYVTFCVNNIVSEHFIGLIPISKEVGASLSALNIMAALENFFSKRSIPLCNARFACMDTTNVNSGVVGGLKRYLEHKVPLLRWIGCNNHKLAQPRTQGLISAPRHAPTLAAKIPWHRLVTCHQLFR